MAVELQVFSDTLEAGADLSAAASQFKIVKLDAGRKCSLGTGVGDRLIGVLQNKPKLGEGAKVCFIGISKIVAGAAFSVGDRLTSNATGKAVAAAPSAGTNNNIVGVALEAATADGDIVTALVMAPQSIQG